MCKAVKLLTTLTKEDSIKSSIWFSLIFISVLLLPSYQAHSQPSKEFKKTFLKAEGYFFYEDDYKLAIPLYLRLLGMDSENANINYKIGVCYLETPGRKKEAIPYLEKSTHNISSNFQEGNYKERSAPVNAYFFLAHAYQVNNRLDEAISTYEKFLTHLDVKEYYEIDYVKLQIDACKRAKVQQSYSLDIKAVKLSSTINAHNKNQNPVVSGDGTVMVYTASVDGINQIYMTTQKDNQWTIPIDISDQLESKGDCISSSLSNDGKTFYYTKAIIKLGIYI